jgi:16S rRNA (cytidine1402-2'-O)-methyltransferase
MKNKERQKRFKLLQNETRTIIFYEAPHKLKNTLSDLLKAFGPMRSVSLVRELTKRYEEVLKFSLGEAVDYYKEHDPRGEYVIILEGISEEVLEEQKVESFKEISLEDQMEIYLTSGLTKKDAIKQIAVDRNMNKRDVYSHFMNK